MFNSSTHHENLRLAIILPTITPEMQRGYRGNDPEGHAELRHESKES